MLQSSSGMFPSSASYAIRVGFESLAVLNAKLPATVGSIEAEAWITASARAFPETKFPNEN